MTSREELRMAWTMWHLLTQLTDILWERYEKDFLTLCMENDRTDPKEFGHPSSEDEYEHA